MNDSEITRQAHLASSRLRHSRDEGERLFQSLLDRFPQDGMVYLQRAKAREGVGAAAEALADYLEAERLLKYPGWKAQARLGVTRLRSGAATGTRPQLVPSAQDFQRAATVFREREPRAVVYDAALVLLERAVADVYQLSPVVAVGALIQSWNFAYYQELEFCDAAHLALLETTLKEVWAPILRFRARDIASFVRETDAPEVRLVFGRLERVLGRVGAAKALHILAPRFFPLWDNPIAEAYGFLLGPVGSNAETYLQFMQLVQGQAASVREVIPHRQDVLKAIDEFNYCRYSKGWI